MEMIPCNQYRNHLLIMEIDGDFFSWSPDLIETGET